MAKLAPFNVPAKSSTMSTTGTYTLKRGSLAAVLREDDVTVDNLARIFKVCSRKNDLILEHKNIFF